MLPPEIERVVQQAKRLEWATLGVIVVTPPSTLLFLTGTRRGCASTMNDARTGHDAQAASQNAGAVAGWLSRWAPDKEF